MQKSTYAPKLFYLQGKLNVLADVFSRLPRFDPLEITEGKSLETQTEPVSLQDPTNVIDLYIPSVGGLSRGKGGQVE